MKFKLIDIEKRKDVTCFYCGTNKSVKYEIKLFDDDTVPDINKRYCCNRCIGMFIDNRYTYKIAKANNLATHFGLVENNEYILMQHKHLYGTQSVFNLSGQYLLECRTDCFKDYRDFIN